MRYQGADGLHSARRGREYQPMDKVRALLEDLGFAEREITEVLDGGHLGIAACDAGHGETLAQAHRMIDAGRSKGEHTVWAGTRNEQRPATYEQAHKLQVAVALAGLKTTMTIEVRPPS